MKRYAIGLLIAGLLSACSSSSTTSKKDSQDAGASSEDASTGTNGGSSTNGNANSNGNTNSPEAGVQCDPGFEPDGGACVNVDDCESDPCEHGTCTDLVDDYSCECEDGWEGDDCDEDIDECASEPCVNAIGCMDLLADYECECENGWEGQDCDENIDDCAEDPCQNDGTCVDGVAEYTCQCSEPWFGTDCEVNCDDGEETTIEWWHPVYGCAHRVGDWSTFDSGFEADHTTNLAWSPPQGPISYANQISDCEELDLAGHTDWRLPTIDDARSLGAGCEETAPGGSCPISDPGCLDTNCGISTECTSCQGGMGPGQFDGYCRTDVPDCNNWWVSSACADCENGEIWVYGVSNGNFATIVPSGGRSGRCVTLLSDLEPE